MKQNLGLIFLHYIRILAKLQMAKLNLMRQVLGKKKITKIGITGSAGKTSTMYAVVAALKNELKVKFSKKANSESGIPLNILGLQMQDFSLQDWLRVAGLGLVKLITNWENYDVYVVEMGIDEPKEPKNMSYLLKIIRPDIGVFVSVTSVHAMQFESATLPGQDVKEVIADEKAKMISALPKEGYAVLNFNDPYVKERKKLTLAEVIGVGDNGEAKIVMADFDVNLNGTKYVFEVNQQKKELMLKNVLPRVYGESFGMAIAVAQALGVSAEKAIRGIKTNYKLPPGRSSLIKGIKDTYILDSSYNASPRAMNTMLDLLKKIGQKEKRSTIAVLGDMRELGKESKQEHQNLAEKAVKSADKIVTVGPEMKKYFVPKTEKINKNMSVKAFNTAGQAADYLKKNLEGQEIILVKGSQNTIFLEIVVNQLMADKSQAKKLLCRQSEYWEEKKDKFS
jgi:UDP-N-acetylmuramoyl-tripeptide--D-alanyl-D-alanine ligase